MEIGPPYSLDILDIRGTPDAVRVTALSCVAVSICGTKHTSSPWRIGLGHAACALLHRPSEPITLNLPQVESMQIRQMNNVVGAILNCLASVGREAKTLAGMKL